MSEESEELYPVYQVFADDLSTCAHELSIQVHYEVDDTLHTSTQLGVHLFWEDGDRKHHFATCVFRCCDGCVECALYNIESYEVFNSDSLVFTAYDPERISFYEFLYESFELMKDRGQRLH